MKPALSAEAWALATVHGGGVLVNLRSGAFATLNTSGADLVGSLLERDADEVASALAARHGLAREDAASTIRLLLAEVGALPHAAAASTPFTWAETPSGGVISRGGEQVLSYDAGGAVLRWHRELDETERKDALRSIAPKLLVAHGHHVLHGSAVGRGDGALVFSGVSGAGKTTSAHACVAAGAPLFSEDLIVLADDAAALLATGEAHIRAFCVSAAAPAPPGSPFPVAPLLALPRGPVVRIAEAWFLAAERRSGSAWQTARLDAPAATAALLGQLFAASAAPAAWRGLLERAVSLAHRVPCSEATAPASLDALAAAAHTVISMS